MVAAATAILSYPNEYTRDPTSKVIARLFQRCGPEDASPLW